MVHAGCLFCRHSPVKDMNVRIFWVRAMECTWAQTGPRFILSSGRVLGNGVWTHVNFKGKIPSAGDPEEGRTSNAASGRTASPTHYRLSCSGPFRAGINPSVFKTTYRTNREDKPLERQLTCHPLFLPPDTTPDSQSRQPPRQSPKTTAWTTWL